MSLKYVRGVKRNQIIQRWLQGIEDPDYEVFPTKKEGKYIVKLRENMSVSKVDKKSDDTMNSANDSEPADIVTTEMKTEFKPEFKPTIKQNKPRPRTTSSSDSTINLEILEQLRSLGEEIRNDRFKKEQKQYIKHVVNKELNKSRIRSKYVPDMFATQNSCEIVSENKPVDVTKEEDPKEEVPPEQPIFKSRIRR